MFNIVIYASLMKVSPQVLINTYIFLHIFIKNKILFNILNFTRIIHKFLKFIISFFLMSL